MKQSGSVSMFVQVRLCICLRDCDILGGYGIVRYSQTDGDDRIKSENVCASEIIDLGMSRRNDRRWSKHK